MNPKHYLLPLLCSFFLIIIFSGCGKSDLKTPVPVDFMMDINRDFNGPGDLTFSHGEITLSKISIYGERKKGASIDYERAFPDGLTITLDGQSIVEALHFDFPKGEYTSITITCETAANTPKNLFVEGEFTPPNGATPKAVLFEVDVPESIILDIQSNNEIIEIHPNSPVVSVITFDPLEWFRPVLVQSLMGANTRIIDNKPTIKIDKTENVNIFQVVVDRIDKGNTVSF